MKWARAGSIQELSDMGVVTPLLPAPGSVMHQWGVSRAAGGLLCPAWVWSNCPYRAENGVEPACGSAARQQADPAIKVAWSVA